MISNEANKSMNATVDRRVMMKKNGLPITSTANPPMPSHSSTKFPSLPTDRLVLGSVRNLPKIYVIVATKYIVGTIKSIRQTEIMADSLRKSTTRLSLSAVE
jgi:hypothetical protein